MSQQDSIHSSAAPEPKGIESHFPHAVSCSREIKPIEMLYGQYPGWTCDCQYGMLTRRQFKAAFGFAFKPREKFHGPGFSGVMTDSYIFMQSQRCGGSAKDRRKHRRELRRTRLAAREEK